MFTGLYFFLIRVRSIQECLFPFFYPLEFRLFSFNQSIFLFENPFSVVDFIFFKLKLQLSFKVCFSHIVLFVIESLKILFNFLNIFFELVSLLIKVLPLVLSLFLFLLYLLNFSISKVNFLL